MRYILMEDVQATVVYAMDVWKLLWDINQSVLSAKGL